MKHADFFEILQTWISLYKGISMPGPLKEQRDDKFTEKWYKGMLKVAGALTIPLNIKNTLVEKHLGKAIEGGCSGDISKLDDICVLLTQVSEYMSERKLA